MQRSTLARLFAVLLGLLLVVAACAPADDVAEPEDPTTDADEPAPDEPDEPDEPTVEGGDLIVGTTDTVTSVDPARVYDYYSSNILFNTTETLVGFAPGETEVSPLLAEDVEVSEDGLTYTFTLRDGIAFHNGKELTSEDVQFSLERAINMDHPSGASFLISGIDSIETPDDRTAVLTIGSPDITFLSKLAYTVAAIVPSDGTYPAPDGPLGEGDDAEDYVHEDLVGTGPYRLVDFREGESITLEANPDYWGDAPRNDRVLIQFFETSSQMKLALERGEIDIAFRDLSPEEREDLEGRDDIQIVEGEGAFIRYIVFNLFHDQAADADVRRAIAASIDRQRIVDDVFIGAAEPLYSMIPTGFAEYQPYFQEYEDADPSDFIDEPVEIDLWYGGERYGPTEPSLAQVIARMLEETGLFTVNLHSSEWAQFTQEAWPGDDGLYPVFLLGWYPDYFDADDYVYPFFETGGFLDMYSDPGMDALIQAQREFDDPASPARRAVFEQIQRLAADDIPTLPLFQGVPFVFAQEGVTGLEETMDPVQIFRYWMLSSGR